MASNSINKIVRGNLNFKPWIASKTPTDIVNSYVQSFYKQIPETFKSDLLKLEGSGKKSENRTPFRPLLLDQQALPIIERPKSTPKPKLCTTGYCSPPLTVKKTFIPVQKKKLLKSPNLKIYNARKYGSSASSSSASIIRNSEERRKRMYKPANGIQFRTFSGAAVISGKDHPSIGRYVAPTRLYNDLTRQMKALEITNAICQDLMAVNEGLKKKISVNPQKFQAPRPIEITTQDATMTSLKGWNHPSYSRLKILTRQPTLQAPRNNVPDRGLSQFGVAFFKQPQVRKEKPNPTWPPRGENIRRNLVPTFNMNRWREQESIQRDNRMPLGSDPLDFVCRSRKSRKASTSTSTKSLKRSFQNCRN